MKMLLILALLLVLVILAFGQTPVRPEAWTPDGKNVVDASRPIGHTGNLDVRAPGIDMGSALAGPPPQTAAEQPARAVEKSVDVGGYSLYFRIIPGRGPAILLESGGGMDSTEWNALAPRLARETGATVIAYDRAGFGKSDLPETEYDLREDTAALWRGLRSLGLDRDIVLVGHSYGGFLIRFEAAEHPESVRGLVFVDPFTVEFVDALGIDYCDNHPMMGKLPFDTSRPETLSKLQRAMVRMVGAPRSNLAEKIAVMRKAVVPEGIPVRVITSGTAWLPDPREIKAWRESHERFTASIDGAHQVLAEKSGHMIPFSQPDLIISVVSEVVHLMPSARKNLRPRVGPSLWEGNGRVNLTPLVSSERLKQDQAGRKRDYGRRSG